MGSSDTPTPARDLVDAWSASADAVLALVRTLSEDDLERETDLPGWTVRDIVAHLAHLECELAGDEPVLADETTVPADARDDAFRAYTERGVAARRDEPAAVLIDQLDDAVQRLRAQLTSDDPGQPPASFPRPGTTWSSLLRDRVIDYWVHEQDIRAAVGRSGGWDSPGAEITLASFTSALPYVLGKKVRPPAGTTVAWSVTGPDGTSHVVVAVGDDGRAHRVDASPEDVDVTLEMPVEDFMLACAGRRGPDRLAIEMRGDTDLGAAVVASMAVTP